MENVIVKEYLERLENYHDENISWHLENESDVDTLRQELINLGDEEFVQQVEEIILCCLCGDKIEVQISGWKYGHNPSPLGKNENDRCCDSCNDSEVIPARLKLMFNKN